jgi:hypothetical protein
VRLAMSQAVLCPTQLGFDRVNNGIEQLVGELDLGVEGSH